MRLARLRLATLAFGAISAALVACGPPPIHPMPDARTDFGPRTGATCPTPAVTYAAFGQTFFSRYCTNCHASTLTGTARTGAPVGYDFDSAAGVRAHIIEMDEVAASGPNATNTAMPLVGTAPSLAERQQLGQLLACGVPD